LTPTRRRAIRDGVVVAGLLFGIAILVVGAPARQTLGADTYAYWSVDINAPYAKPVGSIGAFLYSPVIARLFAPATLLPWPTFWFLFLALLVGTTIWLGGSRLLLVLAFPPVLIELYYGNVNLLIAAAIALGFRYPATWSFVLLTKVTPGVALLWFVVRREWRSLAIALGVTGVLVAVSLAVDGSLWPAWLATAGGAPPPPGETLEVPLWIRLPIAAALVTWGAATNRRWTVPVAATIALPVLWFATATSVLAALAATDRPELREREAPGGRRVVGLAAQASRS
jgi:Glycosyltransferase family 87